MWFPSAQKQEKIFLQPGRHCLPDTLPAFIEFVRKHPDVSIMIPGMKPVYLMHGLF